VSPLRAVFFGPWLWLIGSCVAVAQPLTFSSQVVGAPNSDAVAELFQPRGAGPFPAIVVLHGCNGVSPHYRGWARQFAEWGFLALLVDSFRPRGVTEVCNHGMTIPPQSRAADAFNAAAYLRTRPDVRPDRIGVIGFSHGGWTVLKAILAGQARPPQVPPFAAAVAFYPACDPPGSPLETDVLILIGEADEWTPAGRCIQWRNLVQANGHMVHLKTYPGALHAFDAPGRPHWFANHYVGRDPAAAADATAETKTFLDNHLALAPRR
jgi:dienelactone hydrolase